MPNDTATPSLTLALVDDDAHPKAAPATPAHPEGTRPRIDLRITNADEFLAAAIAEYEAGRVDAALWSHSESTSGGEEALTVAAYLRARATAIRLEKRDARRQSAAEAGEGTPTGAPTSPPAGVRATRRADDEKRHTSPAAAHHVARWKLAAIAGVVLVVAAVIGVVMLAHPGASAPAGTSATTADTPRLAATRAQATRAGNQAPQNVQPPAPPVVDPALAEHVAQLREANNWNVLVLYATEWTRKEPGSAAAWRELAHGYAKLGQLPEALEAAGKRAALGDDAAAWSDVAQYAAGLERWPDAGVAYDKLLALRPDDAEALCGSALAARHSSRAADAEVLLKRVAAAGNRCDDTSASTSVAASAAVPAVRGGRAAPRR